MAGQQQEVIMDPKIQNFIQELELHSTEHARIAQAVREIYHDIEPTITEKFIYGGIGFFLNDTLIGGVYGYKAHVSVVFSRGNELDDPNGLLEGKGKYRRHVKTTMLDDIETKTVRFFVEQVINHR
ncbi:MAG: DUF1801 domain-containing protein [Chloroflexota bacterium]